jgi:hypothetical protein
MPQAGLARNVFVYDGNVPQGSQPVLVGGMYQFGLTTGVEFYFCLELCFQLPTPSSFRLMATDGGILPRDATPVRIGTYTVVSICINNLPVPMSDVLVDPPQHLSVTLTNEEARYRTISGGSPRSHGVSPFPGDVDVGCTFPRPCS